MHACKTNVLLWGSQPMFHATHTYLQVVLVSTQNAWRDKAAGVWLCG